MKVTKVTAAWGAGVAAASLAGFLLLPAWISLGDRLWGYGAYLAVLGGTWAMVRASEARLQRQWEAREADLWRERSVGRRRQPPTV